MDLAAVGDRYRRFAEIEARGSSPIFEEWALGLADDPELTELVARLPEAKQQPNLVFASARSAGVPITGWAEARHGFLARWDRIESIARRRATQTNEAARCATLLPAFDAVPGPLALIEVGASAGLCLYPDRYSYRYRMGSLTTRLDPRDGPSSVEISCEVVDAVTPTVVPEVTWRAGIDLEPLDVTDPRDLDWLEALIWPEHEDRRARLTAAAEIVAGDPPILLRGDLLAELPRLVERAPRGSTVVVFHSAVLAYLTREARAEFTRLVSALPVRWVSNEAAGVLSAVDARVPAVTETTGRFILALDGEPMAITDPHGRGYRSLR
jgi:hypothetical protein